MRSLAVLYPIIFRPRPAGGLLASFKNRMAYMTTCSATDCGRQVAGRSRYCSRHFSTNRRHGDSTQVGITQGRIKPQIALVRSYIARRDGDVLWPKLEAVWASAVSRAREQVAEIRSGRPFIRQEGFAAAELVRVAETAQPRQIIATLVAMAILQAQQPGVFRTDKAAYVQTARRFRSLSKSSRRVCWSACTGTHKTRITDIRSDVAVALGRLLKESMGAIAHYIIEGVAAENQARAASLSDAYAGLRQAAAV